MAVVAPRILRDDTFALVAVHGIADLLYEAPAASWIARARGYTAVAMTIGRIDATDGVTGARDRWRDRRTRYPTGRTQ